MTSFIANSQCTTCDSISALSDAFSVNSRGPEPVSRIFDAAHCLDLDKSKISTPNHVNTARLSGPPNPGVQISEPGNRFFMTHNASTNFLCCVASCTASTKTIILGSVSKFINDES